MGCTEILNEKALKQLWVIYDPIDGAHFFSSEKKAMDTLKKWKEEAEDDYLDSVWNMSGPFKYTLTSA
jgi:predicted CoA-binding protein